MRSAAVAAVLGLALASPAVATDHFNNFNLSGNASAGAMPNTPLNAGNSLEATIGYTLDQHDMAQITISLTGATWEGLPANIVKGVGTVKIRFSTVCTPNSPATVKVSELVLHMWDSAHAEIVSARSPENVNLTFSCPATGAPAGKPDLVITSFGLSSWGNTCAAGQTLFTFSVGVKNQGTGTWPAGPNRPAVVVADMHLPNPDDFGTGVAIDPPMAPGETRNLSISVLYYSGNPAHIKAGAPHPFHATVNRNHVIAESDFTNNDGPGPAVWNGMKVIEVGVPQACNKTMALQPAAGANRAVPTPTLVPIR